MSCAPLKDCFCGSLEAGLGDAPPTGCDSRAHHFVLISINKSGRGAKSRGLLPLETPAIAGDLDYSLLARAVATAAYPWAGGKQRLLGSGTHSITRRAASPTSKACFPRQSVSSHCAFKSSVAAVHEVQLAENSGEIHLIVSDLGKGFDIEAARQCQGLGLTSMQERFRLVGGTIVIDSKPFAGTTIPCSCAFRQGASDQQVKALGLRHQFILTLAAVLRRSFCANHT